MRLRARRDDNESEVVKTLRACGCLVQHLSMKDVPDLLVADPWGALFLAEVKDGSRKKSERQLSPGQKLWHEKWKRHGVRVLVLETKEDAMLASGMFKKKE